MIKIGIAIFLTYIATRYFTNIKRDNELREIRKTLDSIYAEKSYLEVLFLTENKEVRKLLLGINKILLENRKNKAKFLKTEETMRKTLANISHDIKTPLTVICGYAEIIKDNKNLEIKEQERLLKIIKEKSDDVVETINKFFTLAKIESGDTKLNIEKVNINEVFKSVILAHYDILTDCNFKVDIKGLDEDRLIYTDKSAIERVLNNLISNVIKYGDDGLFLGFYLREFENFFEFEVLDKGRGIDEKDKERIFERLCTLDDARSSKFKSSGIGLTVSKRLVEVLGGEIEVESIKNVKTSFKVRIKSLK